MQVLLYNGSALASMRIQSLMTAQLDSKLNKVKQNKIVSCVVTEDVLEKWHA